ncbi:hypothetical protein Egran_04552 [Elaphomyces granulatus]|uniref:2-(3-amino-3-carboxypropyl)histidine synthase subunit 2 n=1 Tax=Elaphomyces granulatus TaxID=519963 RepID=A0A232LU54_9EURO|nr:hypothetical protein Egran_04552 [Elaphomyces granulatus]
MAEEIGAAPILSTPDTHILGATASSSPKTTRRRLSDEKLSVVYDIERTLGEIREGRWKRIALQFPDDMLPDAPRVSQLLSRGLQNHPQQNGNADLDHLTESVSHLRIESAREEAARLYILADTSYGACCVDEVAAEHINADVVVHYGRACLSPTARLPVIYVFTRRPLLLEPLVLAFKETYPDISTKIIITADVTYADHILAVYNRLLEEGYSSLFATSVIYDPSSAIPNRTIPGSVADDPVSLKTWQLFHISKPPTALLLTLSSRVAGIHIYPTIESRPDTAVNPLLVSSAAALQRRYGILISLSRVPIFGILINTLSVKNYLHIVDHVKEQIDAAGKKSYTFVVGKLNEAKMANFSEIGGWVVIGCWESSLIDSKEFWKPLITPFELEIALRDDANRIWTGAWQGDYQTVLNTEEAGKGKPSFETVANYDEDNIAAGGKIEANTSNPESEPPEFDLRTGRYVSNTRPMQQFEAHVRSTASAATTNSLVKRARGDVAVIGGAISPGAEYLRSQRTWRGLGSDFDIRYEEDDESGGAIVVEGRKGIAKGYIVGDSNKRH